MFIGLNELIPTLLAELSSIKATIQASHALDLKALKVFNSIAIAAGCKTL